MEDTTDIAEWLVAESAPDSAQVYMKVDPQVFRAYRDFRAKLLDSGVLIRKYKLLMALAVLTSHGAHASMSVYVQLAKAEGATVDELNDALRVGILFSGGMGMTAVCQIADQLSP